MFMHNTDNTSRHVQVTVELGKPDTSRRQHGCLHAPWSLRPWCPRNASVEIFLIECHLPGRKCPCPFKKNEAYRPVTSESINEWSFSVNAALCTYHDVPVGSIMVVLIREICWYDLCSAWQKHYEACTKYVGLLGSHRHVHINQFEQNGALKHLLKQV